MSKLVTAIADAGMLLLIAMAVPFAILLVGTPIVLVVRLVLEIVRRFA
jgi:hypothetical protein